MVNAQSSTDDRFSTEVAHAANPSAASWATTAPNASAFPSHSISHSNARRRSIFDTINEAGTDSPGEIDNPRATLEAGASAKSEPRSRATFVDRSILDSMTHLPRDEAAQILGLCPTTFKKVCRRAGMKGWPYRRPLLGATMEGGAAVPFSRVSSTLSDSQETLHRAYSSPDHLLSTFSVSHADAERTASLPVGMSFSFSSSSSGAASDDSFGYFAPPPAQRSCSSGHSTHVVDAVMDYLDTLASGCAAAHDTAAAHRCELEAVVDGLDLKG